MEYSAQLKNLAQKYLNMQNSEVEFALQSHWGALNTHYRLAIRNDIRKRWPNFSSADILNLDTLPKLTQGFCSISHCQSAGGYAYHNQQTIGFDVEDIDRIKSKIVQRVSESAELTLIDPIYLWSIKEASFKAMIEFKPNFLGQIKLTEVIHHEDCSVFKSTFNNHLAVGFTTQLNEQIAVAFAVTVATY